MTERVFLDTNIIVYAYDTHEPGKQKKAQVLLLDAIRHERTALSAQVLGEFFTVVTRRIPAPLTSTEARKIIGNLSILDTIEIDVMLVNRAIDTHENYGISYWDALIVAAAERSSCGTILSEDMNHGQSYNGVIVRNPFQ